MQFKIFICFKEHLSSFCFDKYCDLLFTGSNREFPGRGGSLAAPSAVGMHVLGRRSRGQRSSGEEARQQWCDSLQAEV